MALRKIKLGYYAYYRDDQGRQRTMSLHARDPKIARKVHDDFMAKLAAAKTTAKLLERHGSLFPDAVAKAMSADNPIPEYRPREEKRLRLDEMIEVAKQHRELSPRHIATFNNFVSAIAPLKYAKDITPQIALDYLDNLYQDSNGKGYNNTLTQLNVIFKSCLVRAHMDNSPFAALPRRVVRDVEHYRPLTPDEFRAIFAAAAEPWKTAALIAWHTALRCETCFRLSWSHIDEADKSFIIKPGKTARFGRDVYVPIHPELWQHLISLTRPEDPLKPILSQWARHIHVKGYKDKDYFAGLLLLLGIHSTSEGKAGFHSLRASFVTRCDEAGISRRATKGVAGHAADDMTDLYSHDRVTARQILTLPNVLDTP